MGFIGSLLGGAMGFALGGPLGAIAGAALGHAFSKQSVRVRRLDDRQQAQAAFFISTFSMLAKVARADGRVSEEEISVTRAFMRDELGLDPEAENFAIKIFRAAKDSTTPFRDFADQFMELFRGEPTMREAVLDVLVRLAMADGELHPQEKEMLTEAARIFEIPLAGFEHLVQQHAPDFSHHYHVLGLEPEAPMEDVKKAYRRLVVEVHPDKVIAKGMPEEFVQYAQRRFQEVQAAYDAIRAREGRA